MSSRNLYTLKFNACYITTPFAIFSNGVPALGSFSIAFLVPQNITRPVGASRWSAHLTVNIVLMNSARCTFSYSSNICFELM